MDLRITDGTTTVDLSTAADPVRGCTYFPETPAEIAEDVTETATVNLLGAESAIRSVANTIERLFQDARLRTRRRSGTRVYVEYRPVDSDNFYRSEIADGRVQWSPEPMMRRLHDPAPVAVQLGIHWRRMPYWEGAEEQLSMAFQGGSGTLANINNHTDNWIQFDTTALDTKEPAPVRLSMQNATGSTINTRNIYIACNAYSAPQTYPHIVQGEDAALGGATVIDAAASGGNVREITINASTGRIEWNISAAMCDAVQGRPVRLIARIAPALVGDVYVTAQIREQGVPSFLVLYSGFEVKIDNAGLVDLGTFPLPPGGYTDNYGGVTLVLNFRTTNNATIKVDFIQVAPIDTHRRVIQRGFSVPNLSSIVDDGIERIAYLIESGLKYPIHIQREDPPTLFPGLIQRWYILQDDSVASAPIDRLLSVSAYYRPRRRVV